MFAGFSRSIFWLVALLAVFASGCLNTSEQEVVVYAALDKEFSEPILKDFESRTGISVLDKYDQESNKTVGLANEIINQRHRQRADLFWNNEILHSLRLKNLGLLEVYQSPVASDYPSSFRSSENDWFGFAARARVLIVNTQILSDESEYPSSIVDLANPDWKDRCAIARPLFGTTATHAAVLFSVWGKTRAQIFFEQVARNAKVESGNKQVAQKVASGQYAFGLTDTDDAIIEIERGSPVAIVFPDQNEDQLGTLFIPNTLCIIKNGPNTERAKKLVDYLLGEEVERRLAEGPSAQIPLGRRCKSKSRVSPAIEPRMMTVDFEKAADLWDEITPLMNQIFPLGS